MLSFSVRTSGFDSADIRKAKWIILFSTKLLNQNNHNYLNYMFTLN